MARFLFVFTLLCSSWLHAASTAFPVPAELEPDVRFWVRVYTEVDTTSGFVHDGRHLGAVYETLHFPPNSSQAEQTRLTNEARERYRRALRELASGQRQGLSAEARRVAELWPKNTSAQRFRQAAEDVRFQRGQANRFQEGLVRSGQWRDHIAQTLQRHGLPAELMVLPHVESSFNPQAYSHAAAAGLWQFMPATGREFMQVNHIIDERLDPYFSTDAAARLLKRNFATVGSWPLALTAYNHGANGVRRAVQTMGTDDITAIVRGYQGPAFGFASRNFYVSFLAALEIDRHPEKYFGRVQLANPNRYDVVEMPAYVPATVLGATLGVDVATLQQHNPALRNAIWNGEKLIPRGYSVRIPQGAASQPVQQRIAALPAAQRFAAQNPDRTHRVASGETLSAIARRHGTSVRALMALNGLRNEHHVRAGAQLRLPGAAPGNQQLAGSAEAGGSAYRVQPGDSLWSIAQRHGVSMAALQTVNNLAGGGSHIVVGQELRLPASQPALNRQEYTVKSGDSLWSIASRHGVSVNSLRDVNALSGGHVIKPGQRLQVPASGAAF